MGFDNIQERTLRSLEWDRLKGFLAGECETYRGRLACLVVEPENAQTAIEESLDQTLEAASLIQGRSGITTAGVTDLSESIQRLHSGASLSVSELTGIRSTLKAARLIRGSLSLLATESFPRLTAFIPRLHCLEPLVQAIDTTIDDSGNINDEASPLLRQLRRDIKKINLSIKDKLNEIIHSSTLSKALQEPLVTQRNGRFVLPVNASMRSSIHGIVHDTSASGLTIYVEPMAVVELANRMRIKEAEEEREIKRILDAISKQAGQQKEEIGSSFAALVDLDIISARARLGLKYNGTRPELTSDQSFDFQDARHPLLVLQDSAQLIIPNNLRLSGIRGPERTLVITGPNTGGKTVLLKTVGILSLMLRCGLLLPVRTGSKAAIFPHICADIGDEQSLVQSLSTFSSHMTNIVEIVNNAGSGMLVLLDEIGAGTDPKEGAALAQAILEKLNASEATTIATTHFGELKTLAYTIPGFANGSLDFDESTLSPTYKLRIGVPGSSKATTIALRLGLNGEIVNRARELLEADEQVIAQTIEALESKLLAASLREEEAKKALLEADQIRKTAASELNGLALEAERTRHSFASELTTEFKLSHDYIKHLIADLQKQPSLAKAQKVQKDLEKLRSELGWLESNVPADADKQANYSDLKIGQTVRVKSLNQTGIIEEVPTDSQRETKAPFVVRAGSLKIKVIRSELEIVGPGNTSKEKSSRSSQSQKTLTGKSTQSKQSTGNLKVFVGTSYNTLDLRGQRVEAALANLERFLDTSMLAQTSPIMVIHGHGTGAIRAAVREYLNQSPYSTSYRPGETFEGGDGVTLIEL